MNISRNKLIGILIIFMVLIKLTVDAQDIIKKNDKVDVSMEITGQNGNAIANATIISSILRDTFRSDKNGSFSIKTQSTDAFVVKADGYESKIIKVSELLLKKGKVVLNEIPAFTGEDYTLKTIYSSLDQRRTTGAYSIVKGEELESNPTLSFENSLGGRLNGLFQLQTNGSPSELNHNLFLRGSTIGNLITIVDGVERDITFLDPEVIESVQLLKDASLKALYGGILASGVLVVTTKRGKVNENKVKINVQQGISMPTRLPKYLNSYDYATYYNKALENDGASQLGYSEAALSAYKNGNSPYLYPNVNYYDEFLNNSMNSTKVGIQMTGGNETIRYFGHLGYQNEGGLEKYTSYPNSSNVLTMRTSVDGELNSFLTFSAGFNGALQTVETPNITSGSFMTALSTLRPNEFPLLIPGSMVGNKNKEYVFGGTSKSTNNPYGLLTGKGYDENKKIYIQSDFAINVDLGKWIKGLSIKPSVSFDIYNGAVLSKSATFSVYEPSLVVTPPNGSESVAFTQIGQDTKSTSQSQTNAGVERAYAYNITTSYNRTFGVHDIRALINYYQLEKEIRNVDDNPRRQNLGLNLNYINNNKYVVDFCINRVGVSSFSADNRYGYFPTLGLGWIVSEEDFMSGKSTIDYLKIRASYGILGSSIFTGDDGFTTRFYQDVWSRTGTNGLSDGNYVVNMTRAGNPDLGFQTSNELNMGFELQLLDKSLWLTMGYFNNVLTGQILLPTYVSGISGLNEALSYVNDNKTGLKGIEAEVEYHTNLGDLSIDLGANVTYGISNRIKYSSPNYPEGAEGLMLEGRPYDVILGHKTIGVFANQADINNSPLQYYGSVRPGDLKYVDTNKDGVVDDLDRVEIGNSTPRLQYGLNFNLKYKAFNLYVLGVGYGQYNGLTNTTYYKMSGSDKYSQVIIDGLPNGNSHPQLSYKSSNNNFTDSDYWISNRSFFKLRNVELGYTLPKSLTKKAGINSWKFFVRGFNLLTISKIKDLDPESLNAGITNYPLFSTYTGGVTVSF
jgi:TonB-linked SusC/RagA family outer membrane protein